MKGRELDILAQAGLDAFWLDIKAYDEELYRKLCGTTNEWILKVGLRNVKLGNYSVFAKTDEDWDKLLATVGQAGIG